MSKIVFFTSYSFHKFDSMQVRYLFILMVLIVLVSCSENSEPITANNKLIRTTIKDSVAEVLYQAGRTLFITNCASCHMIDKSLTGPALQGVEIRWHNRQLLYEFIKNSKAIIAKDAYAKRLFNDYNKVEMTAFPWMTDKQIELILNYINKELSTKK